ncbi:MAG: potassium transporter Kup [Acidimicrobiia bacterium]|nr:potassium transporter Kup [Acidimicrobiia bacterium]
MTIDGSKTKRATVALSVGALGVVFGDIGTSPLYAFRESLAGENGLPVDETNILGVLSLMFWSLIVVITIKYLLIVMRADNHGEGGILALAALVTGRGRSRRGLVMLGLFGTALLYGDGMITPAISVLSAVEGVEIAAPSVHRFVLPIVFLILIGLFSIQHRGTEIIGRFFGPVMVVWFGVLTVLGLGQIVSEPSVLRALNPAFAVEFFAANGGRGFLVLGSVFLVVTGGEALYADMGHFGRLPIQWGWFGVVLPALVINYLGQGALLINDPSAIENPFFLMAPSWTHWPMVGLATGATIIASQALISGAFSLTVQAVNLGYLPRLRTVQTSADHRGQVYVPAVNWFLLAACLGLVASFGSSSRLAAAYGVAVTLTMLITTILIASIARNRWGWSRLLTAAVMVPLLVVDVAFVSANLFKIPDGGWFPLVIGLAGFIIFTTWRKGRRIVHARVERRSLAVEDFVTGLAKNPPARHPGTGVYLHRVPGTVPPALLANLRHNDSLHEVVVFLSVITDDKPRVNPAQRSRVIHHADGFHEVEMHYGFTEAPRLGRDLANLLLDDVSFDPDITTFFLGRERIRVTDREGMATWREHLFALLARNAADPSSHFDLPPSRSVDIGTYVEI